MSPNVLERKIKEIKKKMSGEIEWDNENLKLWREIAEEKQQFYCSTLGDRTWEKYLQDEEMFLKLKIGYSLFGAPACTDDDDFDSYFSDPVKSKVINKLFLTIKKECQADRLCIAFIFVIASIDDKYTEFPIIRILKKTALGHTSYFLDAIGRLYKSWSDFLKDNVFQECIYCYPKNGFYSWDENYKVILEFGRSPSSKINKKVLHGVDIISTVAGLGGLAVGAASLAIPIAGPIIAGASVAAVSSGTWSVGRTIASMVDRSQHNQSISVLDREGRMCWLSLASGVLGAASAGAVQYTQFIARSGRVLTRTSCLIIDGLEIGNISLMGLGVVNDLVTMVQNKKIGLVNSSQLFFSVLFFCHCTMSFRTAKEVVIAAQKRIIKKVGSELNAEQTMVFDNIFKQTRKLGEMEGNANTIKALKKIENKEGFFNHLIKINERANKNESTLAFSENGLVRINDKIDIKPSDFNCLSKKSKRLIMSTSKNLKSNPKRYNAFLRDLKRISKKEMMNVTSVSSDLCKKLNVKTLGEFNVNGKRILASERPEDIFILSKMVDVINKHQTKTFSFEPIMKEVKLLAEKVTCKDIVEFYSLLQTVIKRYKEGEQIYNELKQLYREIKVSYPEVNPGFTVPAAGNEEDEDSEEDEDLESNNGREINVISVSSDLCKKLNVKTLSEFNINGKKILTSEKPEDIFILSKTVDVINKHQTKTFSFELIMKEVKLLAEKVTCKDILEFYSLLQRVIKSYKEGEEIYKELKQLYREIKESYPEANPGFTVPAAGNEEDEDPEEDEDFVSNTGWEAKEGIKH